MTTLTFRDVDIHNIHQMQEAYQLLAPLRPHLNWDNFVQLANEAQERDQFRLTLGILDGISVGIMGHRVLADFVHGRHLYVDDLVVDEARRGRGLGTQFLNYAEDQARQLGLSGLRLCTGIDNKDAIRFYHREGWGLRAHAFKKKL